MPQLNLATFLSQSFWLLISFCLLWMLLSIFIMPKITNVIEQRKRKINDYIQKAEKLNYMAQDSLVKYENTLEKAKTSAHQELENGRAKLKAHLSKNEKKMTAELNQKIADNEFLLAKEKKKTMQEIEGLSEDLAYSVLQKIGFTQISRHDITQVAMESRVND